MNISNLNRAEVARTVSVVMPIYNEISTVKQAIENALASRREDTVLQLIIVESGSTDGSAEVVQSYKNHPLVTIVTEAQPKGKGHAVRAGFDVAFGDIVAIYDADDEYIFSDIWKLIKPIEEGHTAFVLGSRHSASKPLRAFENKQWLAQSMNIAHWIFTWMVNLSFEVRLRDPFTMWKVFRREILDTVELSSNRFDLDWEIVGRFIMAGFTPLEIPITYESRDYSQGKKVKLIADPISWMIVLAKIRFNLNLNQTLISRASARGKRLLRRAA